MKKSIQAALVLALGGVTGVAFAAGMPSAKEVVLAPISSVGGAVPEVPAADGMAVSVLVETSEGVLLPRTTDSHFTTNQRFHLKVLTPRDGEIVVYNTNPLGVTNPEPVWRGAVKGGKEAVLPAMQLVGNRGEDQLHVVLQPKAATAPGTFTWLQQALAAGKSGADKDVRLVTENSAQTTFVYNAAGQGSVVTVHIFHQ